MSVKTIFKVLLGTIVSVVLIALLAEWYNISIYTNPLNQLLRVSVRQACEYFGQETYKQLSAGNDYGNMPDIYGASGGFVSGQFYSGANAYNVYRNLYNRTTGPFRSWASSVAGNWEELDTMITSSDSEFYSADMITPLNLGVTYLDKTTVERIAAWNLAKVLSGGMDSSVVRVNGNIGSDGRGTYVIYNGFKVYPTTLTISDIDYKIYGAGSMELNDLAYINALVNTGDERSKICVATVTYNVEAAYVGVSWLTGMMQTAFNPVMMTEITDGETDGGNVLTDDVNATELDYDESRVDAARRALAASGVTSFMVSGGGGTGTNPNAMIVGKLTYFVVR